MITQEKAHTGYCVGKILFQIYMQTVYYGFFTSSVSFLARTA